MNKTQQRTSFIQYIGADHSLDYWSDLGIDHAISIAQGFTDADWNCLRETWKEYGPLVQTRIAEVASEVRNWTHSIGAMLLEMLSSDDDDVVEASIDSLNSISQQNPNRLRDPAFKQALQRLDVADAVVTRVLQSLQRNLSNVGDG